MKETCSICDKKLETLAEMEQEICDNCLASTVINPDIPPNIEGF